MAPRTRLDPLLRLRDRQADEARRGWSEAQNQTRTLESRSAELRAKAMTDQRQPGDASLWELADAAQVRTRRELVVAEQRARTAADAERAAQHKAQLAQQKALAVETLIERKRVEALRQAERVEARELDEVGRMLAFRRTA